VHQAHGDYRYLNILGICSQAVQVAVGVTLLLSGFGVVALIALGASLNVCVFLLRVRHSRTRFGVTVRKGKSSWPVTRQMFATSVWVFLMNLATHLIFSTDNFVVGAVLGAAAVASYQSRSARHLRSRLRAISSTWSL